MSLITETKEKIKRIPWKEYLKKQMVKIAGFIIIAFLIISVMLVSQEMGSLESVDRQDPLYLAAVALSSICFILVLVGFSKIVLFENVPAISLLDYRPTYQRYAVAAR